MHVNTLNTAGIDAASSPQARQTPAQAFDTDRGTYAIHARNISAAYDGPPVLVDVNLELPQGELVAVIGPNGAGKSTFFKVMSGVKRPLHGELLVLGERIEIQRRRSEVAYVPQEEHIDWDYPVSVWDVVLGGRYGRMRALGGWRRYMPARWAGEEHAEAAHQALAAVDMLPYQKRPIGALSGGQKKRVFLARALAQDAKVMLLDEPLVGVDRRSEELIFEVLMGARNEGRTLVMVTHDLPSARTHADRMVLINRTVIATGTPQEVMSEEHLARAYGSDLLRLDQSSGALLRLRSQSSHGNDD